MLLSSSFSQHFIQLKSISQALLRYGNQALQKSLLQPKPFMDIANIAALPLFDGSRYISEATFPPEVRKYRDQLENSKAVLFSTHEHEHGHYYCISGPLQNALDWGLHGRNLFEKKPIGFISHGANFFRGENCFHLRLQCIAFGARCLAGPQYSGRQHIMEEVNVSKDGSEICSDEVKAYVCSVVNDLVVLDPKEANWEKSVFQLTSTDRPSFPKLPRIRDEDDVDRQQEEMMAKEEEAFYTKLYNNYKDA